MESSVERRTGGFERGDLSKRVGKKDGFGYRPWHASDRFYHRLQVTISKRRGPFCCCQRGAARCKQTFGLACGSRRTAALTGSESSAKGCGLSRPLRPISRTPSQAKTTPSRSRNSI